MRMNELIKGDAACPKRLGVDDTFGRLYMVDFDAGVERHCRFVLFKMYGDDLESIVNAQARLTWLDVLELG